MTAERNFCPTLQRYSQLATKQEWSVLAWEKEDAKNIYQTQHLLKLTYVLVINQLNAQIHVF